MTRRKRRGKAALKKERWDHKQCEPHTEYKLARVKERTRSYTLVHIVVHGWPNTAMWGHNFNINCLIIMLAMKKLVSKPVRSCKNVHRLWGYITLQRSMTKTIFIVKTYSITRLATWIPSFQISKRRELPDARRQKELRFSRQLAEVGSWRAKKVEMKGMRWCKFTPGVIKAQYSIFFSLHHSIAGYDVV